MSIKQKYIEDENGEIFSPIVNIDSVYQNNGDKMNAIRAWAFVEFTNGVSSLIKGNNISKVEMIKKGTFQVSFNRKMDDKYYAAFVCCEANATGREIVGVYNHKEGSFYFDVTDFNGTAEVPLEANILVVG